MDPQQDPEARIRDLEQPLADRAHTSETNTTPYSYDGVYPPPPPVPPGYGAPYPPQPRASGGMRTMWVLTAVVVTLLVVGAGVAIYFANHMSTRGTPTADQSGVAGGSFGPDPAPEEPVVIPSLPTDIPGLPDDDSVFTAGPGVQISVGGFSSHRAVACDGGDVSVSGKANTVTITGHCTRVTVSGFENIVEAESATKVSASGFDNVVKVENAAEITASGFDNRVTYRAGDPQIANHGADNIVERG